MGACEDYNVQISKAYKELTSVLLNLFTEFNTQNQSLVSTLNNYSLDINGSKEELIEILDEYIFSRMLCCYNLVLKLNSIILLFNQVPCIIPTLPVTTTTTEENITTTTISPEETTTTTNGETCNSPTVVNEKGSYYPYTVTKFLGTATGLVTLDFNSYDIPDRFVVEFDGNTVINTGYIGNAVFQPYLDAAVSSHGDVAGDITEISSGSLYFLKDTATQYATVKVYSPMANTKFEFTLSCPDDTKECMDISIELVDINFATTTTTEILDCNLGGNIECSVDETTTTTEVSTTTSESETTTTTTHTWEFADSLGILTGNVLSGNIYDTWLNNGENIVFEEENSTPAFDYLFNFGGNMPVPVFLPLRMKVSGFYSGNLGHTVQWYILNQSTNLFESISGAIMTDESSEQNYQWDLPTPVSDYVSGGLLTLRITHVTGGNMTHNLFIDYLALEQILETTTTTI